MRVWRFLMATPVLLLAGCAGFNQREAAARRNDFVGISDFSSFAISSGVKPGQTVLESPPISSRCDWDELIVSWNAPSNTPLTVEARAFLPGHVTKYYTLGRWSDDPAHFPRQSVTNQDDADGAVLTDTLRLAQPGAEVQVRVTLFEPDPLALPLKFLGLSFCDSHKPAPSRQPNRAAWGKTLDVPERIQSGYDGPGGWCSPASVSMVLAYWAKVLHHPELDRTVPEVAAAVNDPVYGGTGNWAFNTAYAGEFDGMRAYVTRFDGLRDIEDRIAADRPVILSVSSYLTNDRHEGPDNGHLIVCVGFTEKGDIVANDPGVSVKNGQQVRRVYPRERVIEAWRKSKNAVYLIYPIGITLPAKPEH